MICLVRREFKDQTTFFLYFINRQAPDDSDSIRIPTHLGLVNIKNDNRSYHSVTYIRFLANNYQVPVRIYLGSNVIKRVESLHWEILETFTARRAARCIIII